MDIKNKKRMNGKARVYFLMAILLAVLTALLSGCSTSVETEISDDNADNIQAPVHTVDMEADTLSEAEKILSIEGYGAIGALADQDLTINDMLMYAVQDEYLAHGEYTAIMDKFGDQKPYSNILQAEKTHLAFLEEVYSSYGMEFPADTSAEHIVIPETLLEAAQTGVQAEIDNIAMYERFLSYNLPDNVIDVFIALKSGSESHLLAFEKQVDRLSE